MRWNPQLASCRISRRTNNFGAVRNFAKAMLYPANVYLNLAFLLFGAFLGCVACIVVGKISRRKYFKFRRSLALLLFVVTAVFFALFFNEARFQSFCADFALKYVERRFPALLLYAATGAICAAFLRSVFPVVSVLYILFTFCFGIALYKRLPQPQNFTLTVGETFLRDESSGKEYEIFSGKNLSETDAECGVAFFVYEIGENAIFPLPHIWYEIAGVTLRDSSGEFQKIRGEDFSSRKIFVTKNSDNFFKKIFYGICDAILDDARLEIFALPKQEIFPALYKAEVRTELSDFRVAFEKIM